MTRAMVLLGAGVTIIGVIVVAAGALQQDMHPTKHVYASRADWPVTAPGDVTLKSFRPFRAVYERNYVQGGGPNAGEPRTDRVIVTAEHVGWDGVEAVSVQVIDSGIADKADTNARALTMFIAERDLRLLFEIGPTPGTAKDYYVAHVLPDRVVGSMVSTATAEVSPQIAEVTAPGFGPSAWVVANMDLQPGLTFRLEPAYSPQSNPLSPGLFGRVIGRETMNDLGGTAREAWVVETVTNLTNERASRYYVIDAPPYYLGTASWNLETDEERNKFVWLKAFAFLDAGQ